MPIAFAKSKVEKPAIREETIPAGIETTRRARISGLGQPQYLGTTLDVQRVQNALRSAERGDTWQLFTLFRDMSASYGHLTSEWTKRKNVITGNVETLIPYNPDDADDVTACEVIKQMIDNCRNWYDGLNHLLDATLWPLAAAEKIYEEVTLADNASGKFKHPVRLLLKEIAPIDPTLLCFKLPYIPGYTSQENPQGKFNADDWEAWLRFYATNPQGMPEYSLRGLYAPDPMVHIIHRGNMMSPTIPPNFGGILRQILFPWLLSTQDRDWWSLFMQKYGKPILVGKVNTQQLDTVAYMQQALAMCTELGGLIVDSKAEVEALAVQIQDGANAHKVYQEWCDSKVSQLVVGSSLSAVPKNTGMGSGASAQSEEIREDYRTQDTMKLSDTLANQLFAPYLELNGYSGHAPRILWGGMRAGEAATFSKMLAQNANAGLFVSERGLRTANERFGVEFEFHKDMIKGQSVNAQEKENNNAVKF